MSRRGFVQLPRAVLDDPGLSPSAIVAYTLMVDSAYREDRSLVSISMAEIAAGLRRSPNTRAAARQAVGELIDNGHVIVKAAPPGCCPTYRLTHSEIAPATDDRPIAKPQPTHSETAPGTHSEIAPGTHRDFAPLRNRTLNGIKLNDVRTASREGNARATCPLGDELVELLLALGWSSKKIHREARTIHNEIGGPQKERLLTQHIRHASVERSIKDPFAYALSKTRRERSDLAS